MATQEITLPLPENLFLRLQRVAQATQQSFNDVLLHAVEMGSPPAWEEAPAEFQADLAALDRLNDEALWQIARGQNTETDQIRYQELLDNNAAGLLTATERQALDNLRRQADAFMLRKAHAAALLRWRGHKLPPAENL